MFLEILNTSKILKNAVHSYIKSTVNTIYKKLTLLFQTLIHSYPSATDPIIHYTRKVASFISFYAVKLGKQVLHHTASGTFLAQCYLSTVLLFAGIYTLEFRFDVSLFI